MLNRPLEDNGSELLVALCNQVALMSQIEMNRDKLIKDGVLNQLIECLRSDDDVLLLSVTKALVNLSSGNKRAKRSSTRGACARCSHTCSTSHTS